MGGPFQEASGVSRGQLRPAKHPERVAGDGRGSGCWGSPI